MQDGDNVNNRSKMQRSNSKARKKLTELGHENIYFFMHTRFSKDYLIDGVGFDGLCTKDTIVFFQVKSNCKPTKALLQKYTEMNIEYKIRCIWINVVDRRGVTIYG